MGKYVAVKNFKDGNKAAWKHYKVGDLYDGENSEQFEKDGLIRLHSEVLAEQSDKADAEAKAHEAKAEALRARAQAAKSADEKPSKRSKSKE